MGDREQLLLLEDLLSAAGEAWAVIDDERLVARFGPRPLDYDYEDMSVASFLQRVHPDDQELLDGYFRRIQNRQVLPTESFYLRLLDRNGVWCQFEMTIMDKRSDPSISGLVTRLVATPRAVVPHTVSSLPVDNDSIASLAEVVPTAILVADTRGNVGYTNKELRRLLNRPARDLSGNGWRNVVHPDDIEEVALTALAAQRGERGDILFRIIDRDDLRWLFGRFAPRWAGGSIAGIVAVFDDVTAQREAEAQLAHQATHDPLTGIPNRVLLRDRIAQTLGRQARGGGSLAVLFVDLDRFKDINDHLGHQVGDVVLVEVARRMLNIVRPTDTVARIGGDEFVIAADGLDEGAALELAERVMLHVADPLAVSDGKVTITASIGISVVRGPSTVDEAIHQADAAMYRAKRRGAGSVELHRLR